MADELKSSYIEGRLKGLAELVTILKETIESEESPSSPILLRSIVSHISKEVESILAEYEGHDHPLLADAAEAQKTLEKAASSKKAPTMPEMKKQVDAADELMKNLVSFKKQREEGAEGEYEEEPK
jgi:hypothetical protein